MTVRLPVTQEGARFQFFCELDGISYSFLFRWNDRDGAWYLEIGDGGGAALVSGIKVVIDIWLLKAIRGLSAGLPPGDFIAFDTANLDTDAGFEDLGRRVQILYFTADEVAGVVAPAV